MTNRYLKLALAVMASISCLGLVGGTQLWADTQLALPNSVAPQESLAPAEQQATPAQTAGTALEQDAQVTPTGCTDACCEPSCSAADGCCGNGSGCHGSCCGKAVCCPKKVIAEVKKHCWKVTPKMVCIPGFRFQCNWRHPKGSGGDACCDTCTGDDCCSSGSCCAGAPPKCGRVRCINVLEKHEYKCEECGYEWEVKCVRSGQGRYRGKRGNCCPGCGHNCCADASPAATDVQLTSAEETVAAAPSQQSWTKLLSEILTAED